MLAGVKEYAVCMLCPRGQYRSWNEGTREIKGYTETEIIGKSHSISFLPEDIEKNKPATHLCIAMEQGRCEDEGWRIRKDGSQYWAHVLITSVKNQEGELLGFSEITQDRTQWKLADTLKEQLLKREQEARTTAEKAVRMRDDLLAIVSHDLKNPLTGILAGTSLIRHMRWLDDRGKRQLELIELSAKNMNQMISALLDAYKTEEGGYWIKAEQNREECDVISIVKKAVELQQAVANEKNIRLEINVPSPLPMIRINSGLIGQVFQNLIGNSIKFMKEGGVVRIKAQSENSNIIFSVQDTGPGIEENLIRTLFDRFTQAKQTASLGTGLGLVIAKGIVEAHGGTIWVESTVTVGTTFHFSIPHDQPNVNLPRSQ